MERVMEYLGPGRAGMVDPGWGLTRPGRAMMPTCGLVA